MAPPLECGSDDDELSSSHNSVAAKSSSGDDNFHEPLEIHDGTLDSIAHGSVADDRSSELAARRRASYEEPSAYEQVFQQVEKERGEKATPLDHLCHVVYISLFSVFGSVLRAYMRRFFGLDCELKDSSVQDFMTPLSERICVTASGRTEQTGGALFLDLPSNMLGSFSIGLLSPSLAGSPLAWFRDDHPLQKHNVFHTALKIGFCGCLTTFASWNTQMVVMLDGTETELGPQVAPALFGYIIGVMCAVSSFFFGRYTYDWWRFAHLRQSRDVEEVAALTRPTSEESLHDRSHQVETQPSHWHRLCSWFGIRTSPFLLYGALLASFFVGDFYYHVLFYRQMWLITLLSPCGALLRWWLTRYNSDWGPRSLRYLPWGTLIANLSAAMVSILAEAVKDHYVDSGTFRYNWVNPMLQAIEAGFSGSLSTVSTLVKEMLDMKTPARMSFYAFGTIVPSMLLCLAIYSPIVRYGK